MASKASALRAKLEKEPLLTENQTQPQASLTEAEARLLIATEKIKKKRNWRNHPAYRMVASYCWDRPRMSLADTLLLSPWQKWKKYNRIPWKVVLHALLFIVVATQVRLQLCLGHKQHILTDQDLACLCGNFRVHQSIAQYF
jgi:hypothetical protein